jgi:hypothetical protein
MTAFFAETTEPDVGDLLRFAWTIDGAAVAQPAPDLTASSSAPLLETTFAGPGRHELAVRVTDSGGRVAVASATVDVAGGVSGTGGEGGASTAKPAPDGPSSVPLTLRPPIVPGVPVTRAPQIVFAGGSVRIGRRGVPVTMRCLGSGPCAGQLEVRVFSVRREGRLVGRRTFRVPGASTSTVHVAITKKVRHQLRAHRHLALLLRAYRNGRAWAIGAVDVRR